MSELRLDPLSQEWVAIAARRLARPVTSAGQSCPFCPVPPSAPAGEREASEAPLGDYGVAVFANRFPSYGGPEGGALPAPAPGYRAAPGGGRAEIVLYSPRHDVHLATIPEAGVQLLVEVWRDRTVELYRDPAVQYVFPFENRGRDVGQTIDHPHGQIYGYPLVPPRIARELRHAAEHRREEGECLQCEILRREAAGAARLVDREPGWLAFVPYAPRFPFEVHLVPARHRGSLAELTPAETAELARLLQRTVGRYDRLHGDRMQYMMCVLGAPRRTSPADLWHLRIAFYPIHRAKGRLKYLAGSESGAGAFLQDAAPESMAQALREAAR